MKKLLILLLVLVLVVSCAPKDSGDSGITVTQGDGDGETKTTTTPKTSSATPPGKLLHVGIYGKDTRGVYIVNTDGTENTRLMPGNPTFKWSPDGQKIAYLEQALFLMNPDASAKKKIVTETHGDITTFEFSPNGKMIVYEQDGIWTVNLENFVRQQIITEDEAILEGKNPTWIKASDTFAYISGSDIYKIKIDGTGREEWLSLNSPSDLLASPNEGYLAFNNGGSFYIAPNEKGTKDLTKVTDAKVTNFAWSPDSKKIAYEENNKLRIYNLETKQHKWVEKDPEEGLSWSSDSQWIAFTYRDPVTYRDIWFVKADGSNLQQFTNCESNCEKGVFSI